MSQALEQLIDEQSAVRRICAWCGRDLPGSNRALDPAEATHGMCLPPCEPAQKDGWTQELLEGTETKCRGEQT